MSDEPEKTAPRKKTSYIGVPAVFKLELACKHINDAYGGFGCYVVGSALERPDWRDVDVVLILDDKQFRREFPNVQDFSTGLFEFDTKWLLHTVALSEWMRAQTGLPIDFKIQPQTWANERHGGGTRHPHGLRFANRRRR
ncbi:hypothetical protein [Mesorhizobium sp. M2A.F.Ca.ET.067.02.1.1]|uniref:hypothetical protein n=1 Tax=Mesorhizobium sp. M2A.F.Ca.ET.067.02.1.1 TaxID=2496749 RepID=UPI000FD33CE3|nr:hypothetical protein [Mesorhizobium sp. M2A.F.Ca.ET.067.02.1.1]RUW79631.1 hypothetical protein EOA28_07490 [Mesorhizobium sp. M2A.F.Ca.ET.067.02.1.1]